MDVNCTTKTAEFGIFWVLASCYHVIVAIERLR